MEENNPINPVSPTRNWFSKPMLFGYIFLGVVLGGTVWGVYWWKYEQPQTTETNDKVCAQVIQRAHNPQTGEEKDFPTPCDVPAGWEKISQVNQESPGTLAGHATVGPICPVEQVGKPCPVPPEAYTARQVGVFAQATASTPEGQTNEILIASKHLDANGNYQFSLMPGTYTIKASGMMVDRLDAVVGTVTIKSGETATLDFSIDTGIR